MKIVWISRLTMHPRQHNLANSFFQNLEELKTVFVSMLKDTEGATA